MNTTRKYNPLVSVIIPNFNHGMYLEQRIDTVLSQTYKNFEIILLDDCSTDNSADIIKQYSGNPKFSHIVFNGSNSGSAFKQWSKGISLSKGEYVWIAESDDWCEPSFLENIVSGIVSHDNCVIGYSQSFYVENGNTILWQTTHKKLQEVVPGNDFVKNYMLTGTAIYNASMAVWKRDVFKEISTDFLNYKYCGDWLFWIELCRNGNVFISGRVLNYFRKHNKNISNQASSTGNGLLEEVSMFTSLYDKKYITYDDFLKSMKAQYLQFKGIEKKLDPTIAERIQDEFFKQPKTKTSLVNFFRGYYVKTVVTKMLGKIFS